MRTAKLEMKLLVVLFLLKFEYKLVDEKGGFPNSPPRPDRNNVHEVKLFSVVYCALYSYASQFRYVPSGSPATFNIDVSLLERRHVPDSIYAGHFFPSHCLMSWIYIYLYNMVNLDACLARYPLFL
jgi:hypothetical protein